MKKGKKSELPKLRSISDLPSADEEEHIFMPSFDAAWMYCTHDTPRSENAIKEFETKGELPPPIERAQVAQHLQRQRILAMLNKNYEKADKLYDINSRFAQACVAADHENTVQNQLTLLNLRINEINFALHQKKEQFEKDKEDIHNQCDEKRNELLNKQKAELEKFDEKWGSEEILRRFSSPSPQLIEMVRKEQNLVLIHEFEEATKARQEVERLEQEETEKAQQRAEQEAFRRREALVAQHKNALSRVDEYEQKILNDLAVKYSREEQNLRTRLCKLTIDREKGNFREPTQSTLKESPRTAQIPMALTTPRTRKKLLSFRNSTTAPKLGLKPIRTRPHTSLERVRITI